MRLPGLCLLLLYAAGTGTEPPRAAPGAAAGRGGPGAARVDPRQAWMLLAGSPGRGSGDRGRGGAGAHTAAASAGSPGKPSSAAAPAGGTGAAPAAPTMPEELLRELQLLLRGTGVGDPGWELWGEQDKAKQGWAAEPGRVRVPFLTSNSGGVWGQAWQRCAGKGVRRRKAAKATPRPGPSAVWKQPSTAKRVKTFLWSRRCGRSWACSTL